MIAEVTPEVPWTTIGFVALGLLGLLAIYVAILNAVLVTRKAFGKRPPVEDQLKEINEKIRKGDAALWSEAREIRREHALRVKEVEDDLDARFTDLAIDRQRALENLYEKGINPIRDTVNRILGKLEQMDRS